jgi:hypothetical protein
MEQQAQNISDDTKVSLLRKSSSTGSGGSGNNSDNSAICSLGYNSFGFNFDVEDGIIASDEQESAQAAEAAVSNLAAIANDIQGTSIYDNMSSYELTSAHGLFFRCCKVLTKFITRQYAQYTSFNECDSSDKMH